MLKIYTTYLTNSMFCGMVETVFFKLIKLKGDICLAKAGGLKRGVLNSA